MKKLKRLNIDELAEYYEVIDEFLKQSIKGGTYYYDTQGNFLGNAGSGNELRIISAGEWGNIQSNQLGGKGLSFAQCSDIQTLNNIIGSFLPQGSYSSTSWGSYNGATAGYVVSGGTTQFFFNQFDPLMDNYFNFVSTMEHEAYHHYSGHTNVSGLTPAQIAQNEYDTIIAQVCSPTYCQASPAYKDNTAMYLFKQWSILGIAGQDGHTLADAKSICDAS
jgi:hypothetical protein